MLEKLKTAQVTYGAFTIDVAVDANNGIWITTTSIESILNYRVDSIREKMASKAFKNLCNPDGVKGIQFGKKQVSVVNNAPKVNIYPLGLLGALAAFESMQGDQNAVRLLVAGFTDSISSLVYEQLGIEVNAELRNNRLKLAQIHAKQFHPKYTQWLKLDAGGDSSKVNWGREVNLLKAYAKLPQIDIKLYTEEQQNVLNNAEVSYDTLRRAGLDHLNALRGI